jgi:hypothetical protein
MVKPVQKVEISSFVKGFLTEASPLNFPADASRDEENFVLNKDGSRDRRLGINFEEGYQVRSTGYNEVDIIDAAITQYRWVNAGNDANNEFIVVQFGNHIDIYDSSKESISAEGYKGSVTISGVDSSVKFSYANVDGVLIIAAGIDVIHIIKYVAGSFTQSTERLLVRDIWGLPGLSDNDLNTRPSTGTHAHYYNLRNQGWGIPRKDSAGALSDPLSLFYTKYSKFPANSETVSVGLSYQAVSGGTPYERMYPDMYDDQFGLDAPAARGYYIIDALKRGSSRLSANAANNDKFPTLAYPVSTLPADTTPGGASLVAEFAGRVFYAGFKGEVVDGDTNSPVMSSYVLFSQTVKNQEGITKCYQRGDPTSRENSDLVDTDGGFFRVSGAKEIIGMAVLSKNLIIIASNGVWSVTGGADYGFSATNFAVNKISTFGCINNRSIVTVSDQVMFWGEDGIYQVARNQYGDWVVTNISESTVQTFYNNISRTNKDKAVGIYDQLGKTIRWLYNQDNDQNNFNIVRELAIDTKLGSFTKTKFYNLSTETPQPVGYAFTASFITGDGVEDVVVGGVPVISAGDDVQISFVARTSGFSTVKYLTLYSTVSGNVGYTFSELSDTEFRDWKDGDGVGVDAAAFILTGSVTAGDTAVAKQIPYLVMHFRKTEEGIKLVEGEYIPVRESSCLIRSQWNWATSIVSNKWSLPFQAYRYNKALFIDDAYENGFEVVTTKSKVRGRGRAVSVYFATEPYKDCRILGWNMSLTGNSLA